MIRRWIIGLLVGTMLIWLTSPLFVRSYHSKVYDPVCQEWVYPAGTAYRWRSEGYATTVFGPHGMPGRQTLPETSETAQVITMVLGRRPTEPMPVASATGKGCNKTTSPEGDTGGQLCRPPALGGFVSHSVRWQTPPAIPVAASGLDDLRLLEQSQSANRVIALWGDSQAEGVCVADEDKLWRVLQDQLAAGDADSIDVLPMAHSGEDAADWTRGFPGAEEHLGVTEHFLLVCELDDLMPLAHEIPDSMAGMLSIRGDRMLDIVPDFVIHTARSLIFQGDSFELRRLRFVIGPVAGVVETPSDQPSQPASFPVANIAARLAKSTTHPITILYAPSVPRIMGGEILRNDPQDADFESLAKQLRRHGVRVVDCREALRSSADQGAFPHGFQNGVIGNGHLNVAGYRAIAGRL